MNFIEQSPMLRIFFKYMAELFCNIHDELINVSLSEFVKIVYLLRMRVSNSR